MNFTSLKDMVGENLRKGHALIIIAPKDRIQETTDILTAQGVLPSVTDWEHREGYSVKMPGSLPTGMVIFAPLKVSGQFACLVTDQPPTEQYIQEHLGLANSISINLMPSPAELLATTEALVTEIAPEEVSVVKSLKFLLQFKDITECSKTTAPMPAGRDAPRAREGESRPPWVEPTEEEYAQVVVYPPWDILMDNLPVEEQKSVRKALFQLQGAYEVSSDSGKDILMLRAFAIASTSCAAELRTRVGCISCKQACKALITIGDRYNISTLQALAACQLGQVSPIFYTDKLIGIRFGEEDVLKLTDIDLESWGLGE